MSSVFVEFIASTAGLKVAFDEAGVMADRLEAKNVSSMESMKRVGALAAAALATAVVAIGVESVKAAAQFQSDMLLIQTQAGQSASAVKKLSQGVLDLAPSVGTGPDELATSLYHIESTLSDSLTPAARYKDAMGQLKIAAEGAKIGHADLEDVTNALNATMASGMVKAGDMGKAMGSLNTIVGAGDMKMQDLADAMGSGMLAVVKGYGVNLNDVGAALATFGDNNIRGANAATMTRMAVQAFAVPAKGGAAALKELGLTQDSLAKDMQSGGLNKAVEDLHQRLVATGNDGNTAGELLTTAFGKKAGPGVQVLLSQFDRFESKEKAVTEGGKNFGKEWTASTQTFSFQMDQLKTTVETLGIRLGTVLLPAVQQAATALADGAKWLMNHREAAEALAITIGSVLTGALVAYTAMAVKSTVETLAQFAKMIAGAVAWVASQVAGVAQSLAVWAMYTAEWVSMNAAATATWLASQAASLASWVASQVKSFASSVAAGAVWLAEHAAMAAAYIASNIAMAAAATAAFIAENLATLGIVAAIALLVTGIIYVATHWSQSWDAIKEAADAAWHAITTSVTGVKNTFEDLVSWLVGLNAKFETLLVDAGKSLIEGLVNGIKSAIGDVKSTLSNLTSSIASWKGPPEKDATLLTGAGQLIIGGLVTGLESQYDTVKASLATFTSGLGAQVATAGGTLGLAATASVSQAVSVSGGSGDPSTSMVDHFAGARADAQLRASQHDETNDRLAALEAALARLPQQTAGALRPLMRAG